MVSRPCCWLPFIWWFEYLIPTGRSLGNYIRNVCVLGFFSWISYSWCDSSRSRSFGLFGLRPCFWLFCLYVVGSVAQPSWSFIVVICSGVAGPITDSTRLNRGSRTPIPFPRAILILNAMDTVRLLPICCVCRPQYMINITQSLKHMSCFLQAAISQRVHHHPLPAGEVFSRFAHLVLKDPVDVAQIHLCFCALQCLLRPVLSELFAVVHYELVPVAAEWEFDHHVRKPLELDLDQEGHQRCVVPHLWIQSHPDWASRPYANWR